MNAFQCDRLMHLGCLNPPLTAVPEGEWFCPECEQEDEKATKMEVDSVAGAKRKDAPADSKARKCTFTSLQKSCHTNHTMLIQQR